ncbi:MAG: hypothetical protein KME22_21000 [Hassallia sp. WJT32-NPBG1]|jgi:hypothetical protein|nr:hypothetical protein [Hassallia sp. WJT32-NPBG1]
MALTNVGTLTTAPAHFQDSVNTAEAEDVYKFTIADGSPLNLNIAVHDLSGNAINTPRVQLFKDNGDGSFDRFTDHFESGGSVGIDRAINDQLVGGTYFAVVDKNPFTTSESYSIDLSTTARPAPGNVIGSNLIGVESALTFDGIHNNPFGGLNNGNTSDMYALHMDSRQVVSLKLDGLSADADLRVINDKNHNRIVDAGEVIASSTHGGSQSESITLSTAGVSPGNNQTTAVLPGDFYVEVSQFSGTTNYDLHAVSTIIPG